MKSKCSFILKASLALVLTILMVLGSVSTVIAAVADVAHSDDTLPLAAKKGMDIAATGANADLAASGWNNTTWYLGNDIAKVWDNGASNCTMTKSGTVKFYYDLYLKTTDADVYYRPYEKNNYAMGPTAGNNTKVTTTGTAGSGYNDGRCWYFDTADCTANKYNKIRIWIDTSGNNGNGWSWYEKTEISNISPTLTVPSTGTVGTAITLTGGSADANKIGTLTKTYQYSTNNGSTWTDLASGSYTATSAGTVKFRYKVSDGGVKTSGSGTNGRTARVEYSAEQSCTFSAASVPTINTFTIDGASSKTLNIGETATLSSTTENTTKSVTYSTTSDAISISGTTVKALKPVTSATITATLTDGSTTSTKTVTVKVNTPTVSFSNTAQATVVVNGTEKRTATGSTVGSGVTKSIAYSGTNEYINVATDGTVTGLKPTTSAQTVTATYSVTVDSVTTTATATYKVAVSKPTLKTMSAKTVYVEDTVQSDTPSITANAPASGTVTYTYTSGTPANATINSSGLITGVKAGTSKITVTAKLGNVTLNTTTFTVTVKARDIVYMNAYTSGGTNVLEAAGNTMTYDKQLGLYKYTTTALSKNSTYYINIWDATVEKNYRPTNKVTKSYPITGDGLAYTQDNNSTEMNTSAMQGTYTFYYNYTSHKFYVDYPATYTVTLNSHGGTGAPASVGYEGTAIDLTAATYIPTKSGYKFLGWYTDETGGTKVTTVSGLTGNVTYHAQWEQAYTVTVSITAGGSISPTTASYQVGSTAVTLPTATASTGYDFTGWTTTGGVVMTAADKAKASGAKMTATAAGTVTANFTAKTKFALKAVSNKTARGTVTVSPTSAYVGQTVTITVTPQAGQLTALSYSYAGGDTYDRNLSANTWKKRTSSSSAAAPMYMLGKLGEIAATGADADVAQTGVASTYTFTMDTAAAVTVNATFSAYTAESSYYYNGYDTSGNAVSGYHGKQMTESMVSGEKFSYYHVEGRTGTDQLMTVSNGAASSGTRYVYFTASAEGGWSTDENHQYAYFYNNNGTAGNAWPGYKMTKYTTNDYGQNVYRVEIPTSSSPTGVVFNNSSYSPHKTTNVTDLTKGGYYLLSTHHNDNGTEIHDWQSYDCTYPSAGYSTGTEYFYGSDSDASTIYSTDNNGKSIFGTTGFYRHGTNNKNYAKPRLTDSDKGDYYVNVLYPGKTYTINGVTKTIGTDPVVIWSKDPLAGDDENVTVYAKDGAIRAETFGSTYANIADTKIYAANGTTTVGTKRSGSITNQTYETYKAAKGDTIVIKTTIGATDTSTLSNADDLKAKYYVRGFCINGEVPELLEKNDTGVYTLTYKVPEDFEGKSIEITPIYYLKDTEANPIVTYRVTGFTDELKQVGAGKPGWGDTLYTYPFYGKLGGQNNAFGAYPGQPMVYYKGQYQMQIPVKSTAWDPYDATAATVNNTTVSGVTMSNGYWDSVHKMIQGYGDNSTSADHVQTYDYGDFYKIFNEKKPVDNIVFDFKYRTKKHNFENQPGTTITKDNLDTNYGTNGNGFELLTNFHGRNVDLFGTPLSGDAADPNKTTPVYVVSIGGVNETAHTGVENIAGYYATEWMVYGSSDGSNYSRISAGNKNSIPPEVLVLNDDDTTSFNTSTYPSADENHNVTDWKALYTALEAYRGKPVMISYEAADAQQGQGMYYTGTGGATRNDGRWLYSKNGENITSNIRIDVSHDSGSTYTENPASGESGHVDGLSAYFTNADAYQKMTYATTIDPDKTFDFEAKTTNASYKFVGWYMADGTKITSDNVSHTERSGSYTFVARFMEVSSGQLTLSHSVDTGEIVRVDGHDYTCNGSGSAKIGAVITDADTNEVLRTFDLSSSDITIPEKYIGNDKNYNITVTLEATADTNTAYGTSKLANTDESSVTEARFFNPKTPTTSGKTTTYTFTFNVKDDLYNGTTQRALALTYHSYFIQYKFNYQINYTFDDRNGETQQYKRIGTLTPGEANTYVKKVDSNRYLDKSFIEKMAPYESNFGQDITWNFDDYLISTGGEDGSNYEYSINAHYTATQTNLNKRNITFVLPYQHDNGVAVMTGGVGTKATTTNLEFIEVKDSEGTVTADNRVNFNTIPVLPNNGENGIFTEEGKKNWIAAPATITDGSATYNFQYWSVKPTDRAGENDPDVARCYFQGFNFVAYDNYIITPVYGESTVEPSEIGRNTNITYVETTRNQWNSNGTDYLKTQTSSAADLLYNDFIIAYNYDGKDIYNGEAIDDIAELGVVVERIKKLEIKDDGSYDTTLSRYTDIAPNEDGVNAAIASNKDINLSGKNSISKHAIDPTSLDNKNRIQFYNGIYNSAGWVQNSEGGQPVQNYAYKNYVYRAYSYMKLKNGTVIKSAVPAYFTMYDVATADLNNSN